MVRVLSEPVGVSRRWQLVERRDLDGMRFPGEDVLPVSLRIGRLRLLEQACQLGNLYKTKVRIYFVDREGNRYQLYTTVWGITERYILLKEGRMLPIHAIVHVELGG